MTDGENEDAGDVKMRGGGGEDMVAAGEDGFLI